MACEGLHARESERSYQNESTLALKVEDLYDDVRLSTMSERIGPVA